MARGRKKEKIEKVIRMGRDELKNAIVDASRHKAKAASHTGFHGTTVKNFCELTSFDRKVFGWIRTLYDLGDEMKQKSMIRQFLMGVDLMDWGQKELFDDVQEEISNRVQAADTMSESRDGLKQAGLDLDDAERKFEAAKRAKPPKASKPDALSALAGEDSPVTH